MEENKDRENKNIDNQSNHKEVKNELNNNFNTPKFQEIPSFCRPNYESNKNIKKGNTLVAFLGGFFLCIICVGVFILTGSLLGLNKDHGFVKSITASADTDNQQFSNKLDAISKLIDDNYLFPYKKEDIKEGMLRGMVASLNDPYSQYFSKQEFDDMMSNLSGKYSGIGVTISPYKSTPFLLVVSVNEKGPAFKSGIKVGDIIEKVDGKMLTPNDSIDSTISKIKGPKGTEVTLGIAREGVSGIKEISVKRAVIKENSCSSKMLPDKIGYIRISQFNNDVDKEFDREYKKLKKDGMKKLIVDLRGNPGGVLDSTCRLLDGFVSGGKIVYTKDKQGREEDINAHKAIKYKIPLVVLVNGNSASASEIFSGVIKDKKLGKLVGERTFGKGIVQNTYPLADGSAVKLTIEQYFTPNGYVIQGKGIKPDVVVTFKMPNIKKNQKVTYKDDNQLMRAIKLLETGK